MYKVSEVAEMLSVEKVKIFEVLIVNAERLSPYVTKERHISYVSEKGVHEIEGILFGKEILVEELPIDEVIVEEIEITSDEIEKTETDIIDDYIIKSEEKKKEIKNQIIDLKRSINMLDNDLRHMDDAIMNYQKIFKEDLEWLIKRELILDNYRLTLMKSDDVENRKSGFLDKFKR